MVFASSDNVAAISSCAETSHLRRLLSQIIKKSTEARYARLFDKQGFNPKILPRPWIVDSPNLQSPNLYSPPAAASTSQVRLPRTRFTPCTG